MLTCDQKYATTAYDRVRKIKEEEKEYKKYGAMAHKLPILVYTAGLAQSLELVQARGHQVQKRLLNDLAVTLGYKDADVLLCHMRSLQLSKYMLLTQQVLAALLWYKRFAQSILDVDASDTQLDKGSENA